VRRFIVNVGLLSGLAAGVALASLIDTRTRPEVTPQAAPSYAEMAAQQQASTVVGEFRTSVRDMLWVRVDRYLHGGVSYRREIGGGVGEHSHHDEDHCGDEDEGPLPCGHQDSDSVIPHKQDDWRGILGDWERATSPYFAPGHHKHKDPRETLPLFRLMVIADPHFARAYVIGANIICDRPERSGEALAFLEEGLTQNSESIEIHTEIGRYRLYYHHDCERAASHLNKAVRLARDRSDLSEDEEDAFLQAYHWLVICYAMEGKASARRAVAQEGLRYFPDDPVLLRALRTQ
jgi:hypothetical protein